MSGEHPAAALVGDVAGAIAAFVRTLDQLPAEPRWVLVGGFAVNLRVAALHRITADLDTVTTDPARLVEVLVERPDVQPLAAGKVLVGTEPEVKVDVMDLGIGGGPKAIERVFAEARRWAFHTAEPLDVAVTDQSGTVVARAAASVAIPAALVALKTVALEGRQGRKSAPKVGSDTHDLVRLLRGRPIAEIARCYSDAPTELSGYVAGQLTRRFHPDHDGRLSLARLRALSRTNIDAQAVTLDELSQLAELGAVIAAGTRQGNAETHR